MNKLDIQKYIEEIRAICQADIAVFSGDSPEEQSRRKTRAREDFEYFCNTYLPNYFTSPSARFHKKIDKELEKRNNDVIAVVAAREHAKSVRWAIAYTLHQIIYKKRRFIIIVSETEDMAIMKALNVRVHLESNARILHDFGSFQSINSWAEGDYVTKHNVKVLSRGYKQPVRGAIFGPHRPDYVVIDDISSFKSSRNELLEKEKLEWILGELFGCMAGNGTMLWLENINRKTSAVSQAKRKVEKGANITFYLIPALIKGKPVWPQKYDVEFFEKKKKIIGTVVYEREYMQNPVVDGKYFKMEWFQRFSQSIANKLYKACDQRIIYIDPSYGKKKKTNKQRGSDKKVALVLGRCQGHIYIFDGICGQFTPKTFYEAVCRMWDKWRTPIVQYEGNFGQAELVGEPLRKAMLDTGIFMPIKPYYSYDAKEDRIEALSPTAEVGEIHAVKDNKAIEEVLENLENYPDIEFDDPADALATGCQAMNRLKRKVNAR